MSLIWFLLWFVSADATFETRQSAEAAFRQALPFSVPVLIVCRRSNDPEVRLRCQRALAANRHWSLVGDAAVRPTAVVGMF